MEIVLDKPRALKFNVNSYALMEELGIPQKNSISYLRALLWACLRHEDKNLTLEQVGDMMAPSKMKEISEKCMKLANEFFEEGNQRPLSESSAASAGGPSAVTTSDSTSKSSVN